MPLPHPIPSESRSLFTHSVNNMKVNTFEIPKQFNWQQITAPLLNEEQRQEYRRRFLWHGFLLFVLACITITFFPLYTNPNAALSAHKIGLMLGIFFMSVGLAFPYIQFSRLLAFLTFWLLIVTAYVGLGGQVLAAIFGLTKGFPFSGIGAPGGPVWMEIGTDIANKTISGFLLLACGFILFGLRRIKGNS